MSQSGVGVTAAASLGAPRRHRDVPQDGTSATSMSARFGETEWEARESQRQRELEEARARAAQMEKTMKWWSDCTANWREKWSKVRNERNKARDEAKQLRSTLEAAIKESNSYKREKNDLEMQITQLKKEMEKIHMLLMKHAGQFHKLDSGEEVERDGREVNCSPDISSDGLKNVNSEDGLVIKATSDHSESKDLDIEEYVLQGAVPKNVTDVLSDNNGETAESGNLVQASRDDFDEEYLLQKISMLQMRLEEAQKTIQIERDEKHTLHKNIEKVSMEIQEVRDKCEELRSAKQEAVRELLTLQEQHHAEVRILNNSLQEETAARESLERRLCELRAELERLQAENASEWGKRERLETDKLALERDNKKLRAEIRDLQERSDRKGRPVPHTDVEIRALQQELVERNKEIGEIKHSHNKLKKLLSEANTELGHAVRRAEQYESEVKRLRSRVEELKRELAGAEDELDAACSQVRRLQRTNEELSGQTEGLQVQIQQLQTRRSVSPKQQQSQQHSAIFNSTSSSSSHTKSNIPSECKPNINDLRQLFDERHGSSGGGATGIGSNCSNSVTGNLITTTTTSGHDYKRNHCSDKQQMNQSYFDAKQSHIEDNFFELKSRNIEFERAKQKFDNPPPQRERSSNQTKFANLKSCNSTSKQCQSQSLNQNQNQNQNQQHNLNDAIQFFDDHSRSSSKRDGYLRNSINLDGLKVSEDEDVSISNI